MIFPVKRLAVTALIALYTFMLMWSTVDRTYSWATRQSEVLARSGSGGSAEIGKTRIIEPIHQAHRRIVENPFVIEPPVSASWILLTPQSLHQFTKILATGQSARRSSGRAPPRFV